MLRSSRISLLLLLLKAALYGSLAQRTLGRATRRGGTAVEAFAHLAHSCSSLSNPGQLLKHTGPQSPCLQN